MLRTLTSVSAVAAALVGFGFLLGAAYASRRPIPVSAMAPVAATEPTEKNRAAVAPPRSEPREVAVVVAPAEASLPQTTPLSCGSDYVPLPRERTTLYELPTENCWSNILTVPDGQDLLMGKPSAEVEIEVFYTTTQEDIASPRVTKSDVFTIGPLHDEIRDSDWKRYFSAPFQNFPRGPTAVRFRNASTIAARFELRTSNGSWPR